MHLEISLKEIKEQVLISETKQIYDQIIEKFQS